MKLQLTKKEAAFLVAAIDTAYDTISVTEVFEGYDYTLESMENALTKLREKAGKSESPEREPERELHLEWDGVEWVDDRCGCRYHPDDPNMTHGGGPHVHPCEKHRQGDL